MHVITRACNNNNIMMALGVHVEERSLQTLLGQLEFLTERWFDVGKALKVPEDILRALQQSPQANIAKKNLEIVINHWKEANLSLMWAQLIQKLCDDQKIFRRNPQQFRELIKTYNADVQLQDIDGINY